MKFVYLINTYWKELNIYIERALDKRKYNLYKYRSATNCNFQVMGIKWWISPLFAQKSFIFPFKEYYIKPHREHNHMIE